MIKIYYPAIGCCAANIEFVALYDTTLIKERNSFMDLGIDYEEKAFYEIFKEIFEQAEDYKKYSA